MRQSFFDNRIPPPIVLLITILLIWFVAQYDNTLDSLNLENAKQWRWAAGALFTLLGLMFDVSSVMLFFKSKTTINPLNPSSSKKLVIKGFFKISRNPMYLGMLLISLGVVCYFASPISLLVLVGFVIYITRYQIIPEERALNSIFGDEFSAYKKQVRRWL